MNIGGLPRLWGIGARFLQTAAQGGAVEAKRVFASQYPVFFVAPSTCQRIVNRRVTELCHLVPLCHKPARLGDLVSRIWCAHISWRFGSA